MKIKTTNFRVFFVASLAFACSAVTVRAQTATPTPSTQEAQTQSAQAPNLQTELGLSPDQIQKWRALNQELKPQEVAVTVKVREARRALAEAMEAPTPNEELIKQRAKDLADAQSAMTQLQALRQARVLQILTPEQRVRLREIRVRNQAVRRANQQQGGNALDRRELKRANSQVLTPGQRRALRRQQKTK